MEQVTQDTILIIIELQNNQIHPVAYELIGKAREIAGESCAIHALVLGPPALDLAPLNSHGCDTVYYMADEAFAVPEELLFKSNIVPFIRETDPAVILVGATTFGRSLAPRIAAALRTGLTADCTQLQMEENGDLVQIRPAFSGNILAHIRSVTKPQMATIRYREFPPAGTEYARPHNIQQLAPCRLQVAGTSVVAVLDNSGADISNAEVVVAAGRGIRKKEDLALLRELAALLQGELGVSRALVDAGMADSACQIGYSGHRVKPRLYIACGISGAPQHLSGMKESECIVAINKDPSAPIFSVCDIGFAGDLYEIVPKLIADIKQAGGMAIG